MRILGLSAFFHESACCLLVDGQLVAAASEERFSRLKHDPRLPVDAFRFCLEAGGLAIDELDCIAYYERPELKLGRQLWTGVPGGSEADLPWLDPQVPTRRIREGLGFEGKILCFPHHASHAASAFFYSGFEEAAVFTADGVGEWATTTYGRGHGQELEILAEVQFPHSLGLFYSTFTSYLGFAVNDGEYKVM
ncbi:MAG: carbamoyltransferase, partial [Acidobacteria bacterium]|nr:carbamoyltransferase [Acidobacteriota bacterium]